MCANTSPPPATHLDVILQCLCVSALLQDVHGLPKGAHTREDEPLSIHNVRCALHLRKANNQ